MFYFREYLLIDWKSSYVLTAFPNMEKTSKIIIAPHRVEPVGKLGITQFAEDISKIMLFNPSWDRHWRRNGTVINLDTGDIMIFAFKDQKDWYVIGDAVLLYDGFKRGLFECEQKAGEGWKCCYHFADFRLYSKYISYKEMERKLSNFKKDRNRVVHLTPEDYVRLLSLTVTE